MSKIEYLFNKGSTFADAYYDKKHIATLYCNDGEWQVSFNYQFMLTSELLSEIIEKLENLNTTTYY